MLFALAGVNVGEAYLEIEGLLDFAVELLIKALEILFFSNLICGISSDIKFNSLYASS